MFKYQTKLGLILGNEKEKSIEFLGIKYAKAKRFHYAELLDTLGETFDATKYGDACTQKRTFNEHLDIPERMFYHKEFRDNLIFNYSDDCLNMNIYMPKEDGIFPVLVYIHGGGFDSGSNSESPFEGSEYASRHIVTCFINYRVGPLGGLTNETLFKEQGSDGNYGLDDQYKALLWVKKYINEFKGDPNNVTVMGQSAGAMMIQYLCCDPDSQGLFKRAIMMSGGGKWPNFSLPKKAEEQRAYWDDVINLTGAKNIIEFEKLPMSEIFKAVEIKITNSKNNVSHNMPSVGSKHLLKPIDEAIKNAADIDYLLGFTNNDMYTGLLAIITMKYVRKHHAYAYYFDIDAKGDNNLAFHSSDLRYAFGTLSSSWRPYDEQDKKVSDTMIEYFANFIKTGDPNGKNLPKWNKARHQVMRFSKKIKMGLPNYFKLFAHTFKGDPK